MRQLGVQEIRERLAAWLQVGSVSAVATVPLPFGKLGATEFPPVISSEAEVRHGSVANPGAGDIITRRRLLDIGVYDVWWDIGFSSATLGFMAVNVEDSSGNLRYGTGFNCSDMQDGGSMNGRLAFLTVAQDDEIVIRIELAVTTTVFFNSVIIQRFP